MRRFIFLGFLCIMMIGFSANAQIVCTGFPCYDFVRAVCGSDENIVMLIRPGTEVHTYDPTPADIAGIANCDLFVEIGGESDVWAEEVLSSLGDDAPKVLRLIEYVNPMEEESSEGMTVHEATEDETAYDEHIWTSPLNAVDMVNAVADKLGRIDPDNQVLYQQNAKVYNEHILELDSEFRKIVKQAKHREFVFADRFPLLYFAKEYGITYYAAFPSCAAESEPSAATVAFLIDRVRSDGLPVVYVLELSSGRIANTIAEETGCGIMSFYSVQNISAEDMENGETYVSLMKRNAEALKKGLN